MEAQRALHDRANLQHQLAFTLSRANAEKEEKEAVLADKGGEDDNGGVNPAEWRERIAELEDLKWRKETIEMEMGNLREETESVVRDRDEARSQLKVKILEVVEKRAKCESLEEQMEEARKKLGAATEAGMTDRHRIF